MNEKDEKKKFVREGEKGENSIYSAIQCAKGLSLRWCRQADKTSCTASHVVRGGEPEGRCVYSL